MRYLYWLRVGWPVLATMMAISAAMAGAMTDPAMQPDDSAALTIRRRGARRWFAGIRESLRSPIGRISGEMHAQQSSSRPEMASNHAGAQSALIELATDRPPISLGRISSSSSSSSNDDSTRATRRKPVGNTNTQSGESVDSTMEIGSSVHGQWHGGTRVTPARSLLPSATTSSSSSSSSLINVHRRRRLMRIAQEQQLMRERRLMVRHALQSLGKFQWCTCRADLSFGIRLRDSRGRRNHYAQEIIKERHRRFMMGAAAAVAATAHDVGTPAEGRRGRAAKPSSLFNGWLFGCMRPQVTAPRSSESTHMATRSSSQRRRENTPRFDPGDFPLDRSRFNCWQFLFIVAVQARILSWSDVYHLEMEATVWMQRRQDSNYYFATVLAALNFDQSVRLDLFGTAALRRGLRRSTGANEPDASDAGVPARRRSVCPPVGAMIFFDATSHVVMSVPDPTRPFDYDTEDFNNANEHIESVYDCPVIQLWLNMAKDWGRQVSPKQCGSMVSHTTIGAILDKMHHWRSNVEVRYSAQSLRRFFHLDEREAAEAVWRAKQMSQQRRSARSHQRTH